MKGKKFIPKLLQVEGYFSLAAILILLTGAVAEKEKTLVCRAIVPHILDSMQVQFVSGNDIKDLLLDREGKLLGMPLWSINTKKIEKDLMRHPYIKKAEAYKDVTGNLHIDIIQRKPIVQIYRPGYPDFFLDEEGYILPFSFKYPVHILVATGNIPLPGRVLSFQAIHDLAKPGCLQDIYQLARHIDSVPFWKAQIEEIYVNRAGEYMLTPRVGSHAIIFGDISDYIRKFRKLYVFYTHGLNNVGWNKYTTINLKFKDQIVCTKR